MRGHEASKYMVEHEISRLIYIFMAATALQKSA